MQDESTQMGVESRHHHHNGTVGDGLMSVSHGSRKQQDDDPDSTTNMEPSYTVAWDASRDPNQVSTTLVTGGKKK